MFFAVGLCLLSLQCASNVDGALEKARFALDKGHLGTAINEATVALNNDPTNAEAARILASAYFARSGLDFLDLAEGIIDLDNSSTKLRQIAGVLPATADMSDVRRAINVLTSLTSVSSANLTNEVADAAFDLGLMETIEQFALGVYGSNFKTTFDPSLITAEQASQVSGDLLAFDNHLINSGVQSTETYISDVRQTWCILEPLSTGTGFTTSEYQAFVGCQLTANPDTFDTTALDANIANCTAIDPDQQSATVRACYTTDTTE